MPHAAGWRSRLNPGIPRCEQQWLDELDARPAPDGVDPDDPIAAMRALAARDRLPTVYKWLACAAS